MCNFLLFLFLKIFGNVLYFCKILFYTACLGSTYWKDTEKTGIAPAEG